jgi:hypothetical protein
MPITYRLDKGSALTYQELDDNFREVAGIPNVRWLKLKDAKLDETLSISGGSGDLETVVRWKNVAHGDSEYYSLSSENSLVTFLKNGVFRINANIGVSFQTDSSFSNSVEIQLLKNNVPFSKTIHIPNIDTESTQSLTIHTIEEFSTNDELKLLVKGIDSGVNVAYNITEDSGELLLEWLGFNPS